MGRKCSVRSCLSDSNRAEDLGVTFHKIPLNPEIRPKWLKLCQITEDKKLYYVCSRHFLRADFGDYKGKKYILRQGVLPSIFSWNKQKLKSASDNANETKTEVEKTKIEPEMQTKLDIQHDLINEVIQANITQPASQKVEPAVVESEMMKGDFLYPTKVLNVEQKLQAIDAGSGGLTFVPNMRIEALDFNQTWSPATVLEVDYEENEVLVHFDMYSSKYDEWIGINSSSLRSLTAQETPKPIVENEFAEGERCMASWSDARKFPATVTKVIDNNTYEVLFDDGYVKTLKSHRMVKSSPTSPQSSPLFQPVSGTKQDRRNKKRKINVSSLFGKKRPRVNSQEEEPVAEEVVVEKEEEIKNEQPAHVIGTFWVPSWSGGRPVGVESQIVSGDGYRKSVIVPDPNLPPRWEKHVSQRKSSNGLPGKWDVIIVSPEGKRFRLRSEIRQFIEDHPYLNLSEEMFSFVLYNKSRNKKAKPKKKPKPPSPEPTVVIPEEVNITPKREKEELPPINYLKILQVEGGFQCPIDGCGKTFRRENLTQMHVKHYHPKFTKFLDSTPNVADLAYARTVGDSLDRSPTSDKVVREPRIVRPRISTPKAPVKPPVVEEPQAPPLETKESSKDAEIIKLLNSKPFDTITNSMDASSVEPLPSGLPPSMYPDFKLKDLLVKSEAVPKGAELNLKTLSSSTVRPTGLRTLLPVRKEVVPAEKPIVVKKEIKRKKIYPESVDSLESIDMKFDMELPMDVLQPIETLPPVEPNDTIIEGGEVIKIVRMKQEEIINCTCGITEEDGLMIQCELCFCWQHAYCNNIQRENEVPEKYICYICQNPIRQRNSKKYMHDQDWLKNGTLPTASYHCKDEEAQSKRFEKLKVSHDLSGGLLELKDFMHSVKLKIKIAEASNHPKLYLWSKVWEKQPLPENLCIKKEIKLEDSEANFKSDVSDSLLLNLLKSSKEDGKMKDDISEFPKIDLNSIIDNNLAAITSSIPQPEAAIESSDCRLNLLDHIVHCQNLIEERLSSFEKQINDLDPTLGNDDDDESCNKIRQTTSMMLRDLNTMKEMSQITTF